MDARMQEMLRTVAQELGVAERELLEESLRCYLKAQLRQVEAEMLEIRGRYGVNDVHEMEDRYREGSLEEATSWRDLQRLDHLEYRRDRLQKLPESVDAAQPSDGSSRSEHGDTSRRKALIAELDRLIALLAEDPHCQRAILFGSLAANDLHEWSDIDLIVIEETDVPFWRRMREMRRYLDPRVAVDLLVYTPAEYERLREERPFFRDEVQTKGKVVYERS